LSYRRRTRPGTTAAAVTSTLLTSTAVEHVLPPQRPRLEVVERPLSAIKPSPRHARRHPKSQIAKIAASITAFGFNTPILIEPSGEIIAGHARLEAAKQLDLTTMPTIVLSDLSEERLRAFRIADNKTPDGAEWVLDTLKCEFEFLGSIDIDLPELTGFATAEIENIFAGLTDASDDNDPADELPKVADGATPTTRLGDHRLYCGDAKDRLLRRSPR
jgi:hypothetical protein